MAKYILTYLLNGHSELDFLGCIYGVQIVEKSIQFFSRMIPHSENIISKSLPAIYSRSIVQSFQVISHDRKLERTANEYKAFPLIIEYNPLLVDLNSVIKRNLPLLYCDNDMKNIFP